MKKITLQLALLFLLFPNQAFSRVLTVANQTTPQVAQYNSIQAAHDAAQNGDTIYVYPSVLSYSGIEIKKKIILIGCGFYSTSTITSTKINGIIKLTKGSAGSIITSFGGQYSISIDSTSNILVERNLLKEIIVNQSSNILVCRNKIIGISVHYTSNTTLRLMDNSHVTSNNNVIRTYRYGYPILLDNNCTLTLNNSIVILDEWSNSCLVSGGVIKGKNNIFGGGSCIDSEKELYTCVYKTSPSDIFGILINADYKLLNNSEVVNAGENGEDIGIYGGDCPFVDDGAPSLPTIYSLKVSPTASQKDGLSVEIKAKTNK